MHIMFAGIMDVFIAGVAGGIIAGLAALLVAFLIPRKKCPDCQALLPRFRRRENGQLMTWGGATCAECGCEVDRKGRKIKNDRKAGD
jgi:hypothetical protein